MPADARFLTRPYREGDEQAILDLFARCFPHAPRTLEHFRWKYLENPFGKGRISLTFDEDGSLAGHYSGYAVPFRAFGRDVLAHQIGDTMTDVATRHIGRGPTSILGRTALHFYEHFCAGQVAFNYGFNVSNIHRFSMRFLRADRVEGVTYRELRRRDAAVPAAGTAAFRSAGVLAGWTGGVSPPLRLQRWLRGYQLELVREVGAEWDDFFERVANDYGFLVRRNAEYVRWRYLAAPDTRYHLVAIRKWRRLAGWIAFRVQEGRFLWGDALFDRRHPDAVEVMLRHVVPPQQVSSIACWFPPRPRWFDDVLTGLGFEPRPEPQDLSVMCVPFAMPEATAAMRESLYYGWGDSDLF